MTTVNKGDQLWESLNDRPYRHKFVEEEINVGIAFQIRALRNRQKLTQGELANLLGGKQSLISSWENPNYGKYTLGTLKDLAKAFDVGLSVRFVPFSSLVDSAVNLNNDSIAPASFIEETNYHSTMSTSTISGSIKKINVNSSNMNDFINRLAPGTFPSTAAVMQKEFAYA